MGAWREDFRGRNLPISNRYEARFELGLTQGLLAWQPQQSAVRGDDPTRRNAFTLKSLAVPISRRPRYYLPRPYVNVA
jgi:hypothetical protein